jgi:uncharacterized protein YdeI (YjbR/CyaY-like superfamily)
MPADLPVLAFPTAAAFEAWVASHPDAPGLWLRFFKKDSGEPTISQTDAIDAALCYGWIDGQKRPGDARSWLVKFTPRRARSIWSKRNVERVERLAQEGRMRPAGLREVQAAKADGRWDRAYDSHATMTVPADFLRELKKGKKAKAFFDGLNKANLYAIAYRLQTAKKPETRARRMAQILRMMEEGKTFH